ncbi:MAG: transcriptional repressor [Planctomycetota bacterium]
MDLQPLPQSSHRDATNDVPEILEPLCAVFRRHLKSLNQKYTPERAQILDVLLRLDEPFQAEELLDAVRETEYRVSKATIYRTIKLLQDAGIIQQVLVESEHAHYVLAYGQKPKDLLVRIDSNQVEIIDVPELTELRDRLCAERGLVPQGHRFQIYARKAD